jgi:undecaprenyl-diphosphatase
MIPYIVLGIIQGLTEFFPVSSSAHLAIAQRLFGMQQEAVAVSVVLHVGTALALVCFFYHDICSALKDQHMRLCIVVTTVVTGTIGLAGKRFFEQLFTMPAAIAAALVVTAVVLFATARFVSRARRKDLTLQDAFILGITQGCAVVPGISRSGITMSTLLARGVDRGLSFSFSFLVAIPIIVAAALLEAKDITAAAGVHPWHLLVGFIASFIAGLCALSVLRFAVGRGKLHYFGFYCIAAAVFIILFVK